MLLRKGWTSKCVRENCMGMHFTRWYIKSPNGNFYKLYRGAYGPSLFLTQDINDCHKALRMNSLMEYPEICSFQRAIQEIYKIEESGTYSKSLSDDIENSKECKMLYSQNIPAVNIQTF